MGTEWQYFIEWYPGGSPDQRSLVKLTSQPRYGEDDILLDVWTNSDSPSDLVTSQHPLAVYAQIIKGSSPVLKAEVKVEISVKMPNGTTNPIVVDLYDNGNGGKINFKFFGGDIFLWESRRQNFSFHNGEA